MEVILNQSLLDSDYFLSYGTSVTIAIVMQYVDTLDREVRINDTCIDKEHF